MFIKAVNTGTTYYLNSEKIEWVKITSGASYKAVAHVDGTDFDLVSFDSGTLSDVEGRLRILFGGVLGWNAAG